MGVAGIDMRPVIRQFALPANSVAILRASGPGEFVNGRYEEPTRTRIPLRYACVQPLEGEQLQALPESARTKNPLQFFVIDEVRPLGREAQLPADVLEYDGREWAIVTDANWSPNAEYWDVVAVRAGQ